MPPCLSYFLAWLHSNGALSSSCPLCPLLNPFSPLQPGKSFENVCMSMLLFFSPKIKSSYLTDDMSSRPPLQLRFSMLPLVLHAPATLATSPSLSAPCPLCPLQASHVPLPAWSIPPPWPFQTLSSPCSPGVRLASFAQERLFPRLFLYTTHGHYDELIKQLTSIFC